LLYPGIGIIIININNKYIIIKNIINIIISSRTNSIEIQFSANKKDYHEWQRIDMTNINSIQLILIAKA
jgi:hypothetical protein